MNLLQKLLISIDTWLASSATNYVSFMVTTLGIFVICMVLTVIFERRIGTDDERTAQIKLRINYKILSVAFCAFIVYIAGLSNELKYFSQLSMLPFMIMGIASAVTTIVGYKQSR